MSPTLPDLVDSHCHLDFPDLIDETEAIIARAKAAGVNRMVTICTRMKNEPKVRAMAEIHPEVFYAAGIHPMSAHEEPPITVEKLVAFARHPKFVGIGETGLDYHYTAETKAIQQTSLRLHIEAAQETGLPLIIHARDADEDMEAILAEGMRRKSYTCVMHCFSSGPRLAEATLEMGFMLSISGIAAFPKSQALRDIFAKAPLDRLILETDSPYLAPPPFRGKRNEPAYVAHTARALAPLFGLSLEDFAARTTENFDRLFPRAARPARAA
ncbi:TatD family hydrolase [Tabrizicola sp.]|uniref:TatD family hydrolase n=1 Tax=Tabrizicola sp. TaxID=2005166 RepID=UPI001A5BC496|nr:TatD family hydrolase [Tabrizicola sp.]MBL9072528.1 TatD family hydrolase [Tabrizicola sp.]